ncbi:threonine aldolase family protein [Flavihumibacter fluvii]|uniref:threonine aldolase family protein n=1 Tax=Flavihumibacter fluvii TaxID=2838157 RepID=UPI001BDEEBD0|nr:aminotransferase class I/II-fold pyridoxal phosphate-dependent enzyme [Flavihumibacter fluvii]ULQ54013.1 threonine aldolase family protein [Flavihumibacter fluvii]
MAAFDRRKFLQASGLSLIPAMIPFTPAFSSATLTGQFIPPDPAIKFFGDGEMFEPAAYLEQLNMANAKSPLEKDRYGHGGAVTALEKKFEEITGKEKAMFMPSGTMANQLAISVLSGSNTKVFVQETSHVFRDEGDAAQSVFQKRLVPLAKGETYFTAEALQKAIESLDSEEVFKSGVGAVSVENPVRRSDGRMVPIEEIRKISLYCRNNNIKLHLDGARIYMAAARTGISIKEYAAYFDTIYISLYKYLGASAGAILCGPNTVMEKMEHLVKIHGGSMYGNWLNAAMALHRLDGLETRLQDAYAMGEKVFAALNKIPGIRISPLDGGSNMFAMQLEVSIDAKKMHETLVKDFRILYPRPGANNQTLLSLNETILYRDADYIMAAFKKSVTR